MTFNFISIHPVVDPISIGIVVSELSFIVLSIGQKKHSFTIL